MKRIILITGATSGIGKSAALQLAQKGHQLILLSRNKERLKQTKKEIIKQSGNKHVEVIECDLASQKEIRKAAKQLHSQYYSIDILINNAGIHSKSATSAESIEKTFAVNHLAPFLLTGLLLDLLKKGTKPRIINVSSNAHRYFDLDLASITETGTQKLFPAYGRSKLANILFTIELAKRLKKHDITVNTLHPGFIQTNIGMDNPTLGRKVITFLKKFIAETPEKGGKRIVYLALSDKVENVTGKYFVRNRIAVPSPKALNKKHQKELWTLSEKLTAYKYQS